MRFLSYAKEAPCLAGGEFGSVRCVQEVPSHSQRSALGTPASELPPNSKTLPAFSSKTIEGCDLADGTSPVGFLRVQVASGMHLCPITSYPESQSRPQTVPLHVAFPCGGVGHGWHDVPQLDTL